MAILQIQKRQAMPGALRTNCNCRSRKESFTAPYAQGMHCSLLFLSTAAVPLCMLALFIRIVWLFRRQYVCLSNRLYLPNELSNHLMVNQQHRMGA